MNKLIIASNNDDKVREIKEILQEFPVEIESLKSAKINIDIEETGTTFMENAYIKAKGIFDITNSMVLADDSGLVVDALDGAPGIYSARFAGEHGNSKKNNEKLLKLMSGKPFDERQAKFVCAMVLIVDSSRVIEVQGEIPGYIANKEMGKNGFGYDPLFYIPKYKMTFGEMDSKLKNSISHRSNALKKLVVQMKKLF